MISPEPLQRIRNGIFSSNTYFYQLPGAPKKCLVIDPGLDFAAIDEHLAAHQLTPVGVLCTHGHFDHLGSAQNLKDKYQCPIFLHEADGKVSRSANFLLMACKIKHRIITPVIDTWISGERSAMEIGGVSVRWIHVPGHTPGSCLIEINGMVFTGDTFYKNAVGLSDFPGEDRAQLIQSILKIWEQIPDGFMINPGHGGSDPFGNIKRNNRPLRALLGFETQPVAQRSLFDEE